MRLLKLVISRFLKFTGLVTKRYSEIQSLGCRNRQISLSSGWYAVPLNTTLLLSFIKQPRMDPSKLLRSADKVIVILTKNAHASCKRIKIPNVKGNRHLISFDRSASFGCTRKDFKRVFGPKVPKRRYRARAPLRSYGFPLPQTRGFCRGSGGIRQTLEGSFSAARPTVDSSLSEAT